MGAGTLCFVLPLFLMGPCFDSEAAKVVLEKTLGSKPDVTLLCTNRTMDVTLIVCKIHLKGREGCRLMFEYEKGFEKDCDSRFTLMTENQTVFLHLTDLKPEDSGNYSCECSHPRGTDILYLSVTVEESEDVHSSTGNLILRAVVIIIPVVMLGFIHRRLYRGLNSRTQPEELSNRPNQEPQDIEPYSIFMQRDKDLYPTVKMNDDVIPNCSTQV